MVNNIPPGNFARKSVGKAVGNRLGKDGGLNFAPQDSDPKSGDFDLDTGDIYLATGEGWDPGAVGDYHLAVYDADDDAWTAL